MLFDGEWTEYDTDLQSTDPLTFVDTKPYRTRLDAPPDGSSVTIASANAATWPWATASIARPVANTGQEKRR